MHRDSELAVGDTFRVSVPMSGRDVTWTVEQVGQRELKLSGVWYRLGQIERWIDMGQLVKTERVSAQGEADAKH